MPGPNKYNPGRTDATSKASKMPSWSCSKASRFDTIKKSTPGPGSYNIASKGVEGYKYTHISKPNINSELLSHGITASPFKMRTKPGPGEY